MQDMLPGFFAFFHMTQDVHDSSGVRERYVSIVGNMHRDTRYFATMFGASAFTARKNTV